MSRSGGMETKEFLKLRMKESWNCGKEKVYVLDIGYVCTWKRYGIIRCGERLQDQKKKKRNH